MKYQFIVEKTEQELRQLLREPNVTDKKKMHGSDKTETCQINLLATK